MCVTDRNRNHVYMYVQGEQTDFRHIKNKEKFSASTKYILNMYTISKRDKIAK